MRKRTFAALDLAAQRIADRLIPIKGFIAETAAKKPYMKVKQFILDNKSILSRDMYGEVNMENVCKTTRQIHYLTNEVLHRLRRGRFFKDLGKSAYTQMTFNF